MSHSALSSLADARAFHTALVQGVTGSGKTELYLRLAERVRAQGRGVHVLVPEIALTPQVAALFRRRFGSQVAIQHSGLSDGERHDQWHRIRRGEVDVVVGTRSAVFAPLAAPGLIVIDEEHDTSYKQDETPRYHGRDVAVVRGKLSGAVVVLGSATPSMESFANARSGRYTLITMSRRVLDRPLADVRIVNMREEMAEDPEVVLSRPLVECLGRRLEAGCEVTPHHLALTDAQVAATNFDTNTKMNPPLRSVEHVEALIGAVRDGTVDCLATDHAPHHDDEKALEFDLAPFGIVGLQTAIPVTYDLLVPRHKLPLRRFVALWSSNPARVFGLPGGTLAPGSPADITLFDPDPQDTVDPERFRSRSRNTPFAGQRLRGWPVTTIVEGRSVWQRPRR